MQLRNGNLESFTIRCLNYAEFDHFSKPAGVLWRRNLATRWSLRALGLWYLGCDLGDFGIILTMDTLPWERWNGCFHFFFGGFPTVVVFPEHFFWLLLTCFERCRFYPSNFFQEKYRNLHLNMGDPGCWWPQDVGWLLCLDGVYNTVRWRFKRLWVKCDLRAYQCGSMDIRVPKPLGSDTGGFSGHGAQKHRKYGTSRFVSVSFFDFWTFLFSKQLICLLKQSASQ